MTVNLVVDRELDEQATGTLVVTPDRGEDATGLARGRKADRHIDNRADRKMALSIKDAETDRAVRELAARTGESITVAVRKSVEERLDRERARTGETALAAELLAIGARFRALPVLDGRSAEDMLYDEHGLPR